MKGCARAQINRFPDIDTFQLSGDILYDLSIKLEQKKTLISHETIKIVFHKQKVEEPMNQVVIKWGKSTGNIEVVLL